MLDNQCPYLLLLSYYLNTFRFLRHPKKLLRLGHEDRCFTCHSARSCRDCHARAPTTHTPGFVAPGQTNVDATAHAMLGRLHPTSCLTCHRELTAECTTCHPVAEVWSWEGRAREALERWQPLLHEAVETTP